MTLTQIAESCGVQASGLHFTRRRELFGLRPLLTVRARVATGLFWVMSFCGLLLVFGISTWLPTIMSSSPPRRHQRERERKRVSGSSVSAIDCSTDLVRQAAIRMAPPGPPQCIDYCLANGGAFETRNRHRGQHRRLVRRARAVGFL
jgi:hypothetical protein